MIRVCCFTDCFVGPDARTNRTMLRADVWLFTTTVSFFFVSFAMAPTDGVGRTRWAVISAVVYDSGRVGCLFFFCGVTGLSGKFMEVLLDFVGFHQFSPESTGGAR